MPSPPLSRAVRGRAVAGEVVFVFFDKSSFLGRWRAVGKSGDAGSFFTIILGGWPAFRVALGGEDFAVAASAPPLGLPLPERGCCCAAFGVPEGAAVVRCAEGEDAAETDAAAL